MNRGFCLIKFIKVKSARRVIEIKNHTLMGRLVTCREYLKGEQLKEGKKSKNDKKIYISGLPTNTTNIDIIKAFSFFGEVESGYTLKETSTGLSKGFGFVTFESKTSVDKALKSVSKIRIFGKVIDVAPFASGGLDKDSNHQFNNQKSDELISSEYQERVHHKIANFHSNNQKINLNKIPNIQTLNQQTISSFGQVNENYGSMYDRKELFTKRAKPCNFGVWSKLTESQMKMFTPNQNTQSRINGMSKESFNNLKDKHIKYDKPNYQISGKKINFLSNIPEHCIRPTQSKYFSFERAIYQAPANIKFNRQ